jgi:hypothetical protein
VIEVELHCLGPMRRRVTYRTKRACAADICRAARRFGAIQGGTLELELKPESRPDLGGGFFVHATGKRERRKQPARVVGICVWREVDDDSCDMEA